MGWRLPTIPIPRRLLRLWRHWLRAERPRQPPAWWLLRDTAAVLVVCALVAMVSSWPWLAEPNLRPGMLAPFTVRAPETAAVVDSTALEERRQQMLPRTTVQVVDQPANQRLRRLLDEQIQAIEQMLATNQPRVEPVTLTDEERRWLRRLDSLQLTAWAREVRQAQLRMLSQGLAPGLSEGQLVDAATMQLEDLSDQGRNLGARLLVQTLHGQTNLRSDPALSQRRIEALISQQGIPTIAVEKGDLVVRQGEAINAQAFDVLDHFGLVNRRPRPLAWLGHFLESLAVTGTMVLLLRRWRSSLEPRQAMLALGTLLAVQGLHLWLDQLASPMVLLVPPTLLLAQGLGTACGLAWLAAATLLWPIPLSGLLGLRLLLAAATAGVAAVAAGRQRTRAELLQLAVLLPGGAVLLQWMLLQGRGQPGQFDLLSEALLLGGLLMAGLLLAPLVETFFGLMTRTRLLELADLERPLLRRLSCEAPGTFEHTLMIAGLAEEGARSIGADVDLVRTGALYHDVGKLHGPQWFIENQEEGANPHDKLDDPFASAAILQAHVDEGLRLARRYRLPRPLADFIPEHQGTLKMGYFFHQARERDPSVPEQLFRYRGPTPRSRETAILMLADGCEAALRSLPPGTNEAEARAMVRRILEARMQDGQLANSGIGRAELELLIRAFVRVWKRMRHRRIPYPIPRRKAFSA
ncbi:HDIG domain-containing metalloprotein [Cyanobium sp. NIES-981]|uniref:HDIG domain-containing metalloprotein n=1 Tax=Cyanobium sp. NIES-981 TaxID=1851505 RepID=UPI0007DE1AB6|nr:HDIG domain-containing metalloprotein [Cyanobium sp. NIES-981]SBO42936.1 Metal dependent phosphohydrolase [Cyanobium sp. NIES-981]